MKIMVLDNYDSFTYNLVHYLKDLTENPVEVHRNDKIELEEVGQYDKNLISPGPGVPKDAGITLELLRRWGGEKSIFGVCLGCQAIAEAYGGSLLNLERVYHGISTYMKVLDENEKIFSGIPKNFTAGRYHSWVINEEDLPVDINVTVRDDEGQIMAISHKKHNLRGVQFHPESVLTRYGKQMILNWLES